MMPLVKRVALQLRGHLPAHVELDDLVGAGTVGLIDAVRKFDPSKGVTIESYARFRIRGAILDSLREEDPASRDMRRRIKKIESACQNLEFELGRPASDAEMAGAMGLSLEQWYEMSSALHRLGFAGAGGKIFSEARERVAEENLAASPGDDPFELCYRREQRDIFRRVLECLTERERSVMTLYYQDALTMKQIGSRLGIDESRVSQLHSGAIARLRARVAALVHAAAGSPGGFKRRQQIAAGV
jgi:RNA polymerase sigma factor FliA